MRKRILCILVCCLLLSAWSAVPSFAQDASPCAEILIASVRGIPGTLVQVDVSIQDNPGLAAFRFALQYDADVLQPLHVLKGEVLTSGSLYSNVRSANRVPLVVNWDDPADVTQDGVLFSVQFRIDPAAAAGEYPLALSYRQADVCNARFEDVILTWDDPLVQVICPGDANEDGKLNLLDAALIARWLVGGWDVTIHETKADADKDGAVSLKDVVLIRRLLAGGWDVDLL